MTLPERTRVDILVNGTDVEKYKSLAELPAAEYDRVREIYAKDMHIRVTTLDTEVAKRRRPEQAKALMLSDPESWPEPVNGTELLDSIEQQIASYVSTTEVNRVAIVLWILMTYAVEGLFILPLLLITSPQKQCGKSTLQILLNKMCRKPLLLSNASTAPMFRIIEKSRPTLLLDEVDTWLRRDDDQSLRGLINAGHTRDTARFLRCDGDNFEPRVFDCFCPKALSGINARNLSDTVTDRSIVIELARRGPNESVDRLRQDRLNLDHLRCLARRWADDHLAMIVDSDPSVPPELSDRAQDNWRSLLTLADLCAGAWPERARQAARKLSTADTDEDDHRLQLLADIGSLFKEHGDSIRSADLIAYLAALEARPWAEWSHGRPLSAVQLARLLKPFGIVTRDVREPGGKVYKTYDRTRFDDAFARYLKIEVSSATPRQSPDFVKERADSSATSPLAVAARSATCTAPVAAQNGANARQSSVCCAVADQKPEAGVLEI